MSGLDLIQEIDARLKGAFVALALGRDVPRVDVRGGLIGFWGPTDGTHICSLPCQPEYIDELIADFRAWFEANWAGRSFHINGPCVMVTATDNDGDPGKMAWRVFATDPIGTDDGKEIK